MIEIRKPLSRNADDDKILYESFVVLSPHRRPLSGDEEYAIGQTPGQRLIYRCPYSVWFEGYSPGTWELSEYDPASDSWIETNLFRIDRVGRRIDFFVERLRAPALPVVSLNEVTLGGEPVTLGGERVRL